MPDYKVMYYHLAGRMATAVEVLDGVIEATNATNLALIKSTSVLVSLQESLKKAQQATEDMYVSDGNDDSDADGAEIK